MCNEETMILDSSESKGDMNPLNAEAFYRQAEYFFEGSNGVAQSYRNAFQCYRMAAQLDHIPAVTATGYMYQLGLGMVCPDGIKAFRYYTRAANAGEVTAMYNLSFCYATGTGTWPDLRKACNWCEKAAQAGNVNAQASLVFFLNRGYLDSELEKQVVLDSLHSAANCQHSAALGLLGELYREGNSDLNIQADASMSAHYYNEAAKGDSATAKYHVACEGLQTAETLQERDEAIQMLYEAANKGYYPAKRHKKCKLRASLSDWSTEYPLCDVQRSGRVAQYVHANSIRTKVKLWILRRIWKYL